MKRFRFLITVALLITGAALIGQGGYIQLKAEAANWLIHTTWADREPGDTPNRPWPWADTWVTARLKAPHLGVAQYVMKDASGESLAFGPGEVPLTSDQAQSHQAVIAGHRDTHFAFLRDLRQGDRLLLERFDKTEQAFQVITTQVIDATKTSLNIDPDQPQLMLITCWPFDALVPGGPMRYIVVAEPV